MCRFACLCVLTSPADLKAAGVQSHLGRGPACPVEAAANTLGQHRLPGIVNLRFMRERCWRASGNCLMACIRSEMRMTELFVLFY